MILAVVVDALPVKSASPRLQRDLFLFNIGGEVEQVFHQRDRHPKPLQIGVAISQAAWGRLQVDLAVWQPRYVLHGVRIPLRGQGGCRCDERKSGPNRRFLHGSSREYTAAVEG